MAKFVIHKRGFFYTDESFAVVEEAKGSISGIFNSLEEAKIAKEELEISSIQQLSGWNVVDFIFDHPNYNEVYKRLEEYYKSEFSLTVVDRYRFDFPKDINRDQALFFKETMGLSFHDIVEYGDDEELNPKDFNLQDDELGEF